ncbi:MAG: F0F1 ATP synthase subunit B [Planctomycetota bacterium]
MDRMKTAATTVAITAFTLLTPLALAAADEGGHGGDHEKAGVVPTLQQGVVNAIIAIVVFGIVIAIFSTAVWPKITEGLDARAAKIRSEINAAERAREQANESLQEYEKALAEARAEAQRIIDETKAKQADLAAELRSKADRELTELRDKARRDIEAAKKAAITEIYSESVALATQMASKVLEREVSADDHKKLLDESVDQLETAGA